MQRLLLTNGVNILRMIYIIKYRTNDLVPDKGKQIEFGKSIVSKVFGFTNDAYDVVSKCISLSDGHEKSIKTHFKLSGARGDYKIYQNDDGSEDLKDVLINVFNLTPTNNSDDYLGIKKEREDAYVFYHIPKGTEFSKCFETFGNAFEVINEDDSSSQSFPTYQSIFFGTPGSGKSFAVNKLLKEKNVHDEFVFRTTFFPDYDYAQFVGCYKPTMRKNEEQENVAEGRASEPSVPFNQSRNKKIEYAFVPQQFTKAYIAAWQNPEVPVFLVVEEINRGNCASIFGDLFQLLDRKDGVSDYSINADEDLKNYLVEKLGEDNGGIKNGKLTLPKNFNIIATMNTSDQSLFPMDSAFKRRWDWKYFAIKEEKDEDSGAPLKHKIVINNNKYDWWSFVKAVNKKIYDVTHSEDKKIGYWFAKPDENKEINTEVFVSKVLFFLWSDVFKDTEDNPFEQHPFTNMFDENGEVVEKEVELFIKVFVKSDAEQQSGEQMTINADGIDNNSTDVAPQPVNDGVDEGLVPEETEQQSSESSEQENN